MSIKEVTRLTVFTYLTAVLESIDHIEESTMRSRTPNSSSRRRDHDDGSSQASLSYRTPVTRQNSSNSRASDHIPHLFSAPTVDTLDEDGTTDFYSTTKERLSNSFFSSKSDTAMDSSPGRTRTPKVQYPPARRSAPPRPKNLSSRSRSNGSVKKQQKKKRKPRDFQHEQDAMTVSVREIDVETRSAFEPNRLISVEEWKAWADEADAGRSLSIQKMSPSLQHLKMLHKFQQISSVRQLCFSTSLGTESDAFVPWDDDIRTDGKQMLRRRSKPKRDGRYRSIDPVKASMSVLPKQAPLLSNRKRRMPRRSDVGFPNASQEEIMSKQKEIQCETEWEEASPRLIVLTTSDALGTSMQDEMTDPVLPENIEWNGGGLEGMPLAGKELMMAKERNVRLFSSQQRNDSFLANQKWAKARRSSVLAPPLDSSFSNSAGWRPRPFYDRPAGLKNMIACPLNVSFDIGNIEPLVCSLALYSLPDGKVTEEFWFPAGNWKGMVHLEAANALSGPGESLDIEAAWHKRKHKALFPFDPNAISRDIRSVHVVLQVYKTSQVAGSSPYYTSAKTATGISPHPKKKKSVAKRMKRRLEKMAMGNKEKEFGVDSETARQRSKMVFDKFGTELLTPLCFGILPFMQSKEEEGPNLSTKAPKISWPEGPTQLMQLYAFPDCHESHDEFLERLQAIAAEEKADAIAAAEETAENGQNAGGYVSDASVPTADSASDDKSGTSSEWLSPEKSSLTKARTNSAQSKHDTVPFAGTATIFTSVLGVDFTQAVLQTPAAFVAFEKPEHANSLPRLVVDVSGDCAIMMSPDNVIPPESATGFVNEQSRKRSNLVRLPQARFPSGYVDASEVRETLFLPPRTEKRHNLDTPNLFRSLLNLLYLYPRLLKVETDKGKYKSDGRASTKDSNKNQHYSIRVRLVKNISKKNEETGKVETFYKEVESFYNPAPWSSEPMINAIYTKIPPFQPGKQNSNGKSKAGIKMRDEIKVRLPMVLDGSFFLEFSVFTIELDNDFDASAGSCGISAEKVAKTMIPLSTSSTRERVSGVRVTTVIPNGLHRVKIGDFELQLETRLFSSIHVNDATAATVLRDFPFTEAAGGSNTEAPAGELYLVRSLSTANIPESKSVSFQEILGSASEDVLFAYFPFLMYMHLCNMVNRGAPKLDMADVSRVFEPESHDTSNTSSSTANNRNFMTENMGSLFEVLRKTKLKLTEGASSYHDASRRTELYLKNFIDTYDEFLLSPGPKTSKGKPALSDSQGFAQSQSYNSFETPDKTYSRGSQDEYADDDIEDALDSGVNLRRKSTMPKEIDQRISKRRSALTANGVPFSRTPYGASKIDKMKFEAELYQEGTHPKQMVDDDETIATMSTYHTLTNVEDDKSKWDFMDDSTIVNEPISGKTSRAPDAQPPNGTSYLSDTSALAQRFKTAAQVMIAPCVAPGLSNVLGTTKTPTSPKLVDSTFGQGMGVASRYSSQASPKKPSMDYEPAGSIYSPGSDFEDDGQRFVTDRTTSEEFPNREYLEKLRGADTSPVLKSSVNISGLRDDENMKVPHYRTYLYESIIVSWMQSWMDYVDVTAENDKDTRRLPDHNKSLLLISAFDPSEQRPHQLFQFYDHMDILLPLCLKSLVLKCDAQCSEKSPLKRAILDSRHLRVLEPFVEMLARGLMGQALEGDNAHAESEKALLRALTSLKEVVEFLVGLFSVVHPEHVSLLVTRYFRTLCACEFENLNGMDDANGVKHTSAFSWTEDSLRRVRCSRQLRLHTVEMLSILPNFVALNYPLRLAEQRRQKQTLKPSWATQFVEAPRFKSDRSTKACPYPDGMERLPVSGWLVDLLASECLSICSASCEAVVAEALAHAESSKQDKEKTTLLKNRPGKILKREDLLRFQSTAIHSINIVYELLIRRHAMDVRFQTEKSRDRIAVLLAPCIMKKSLGTVRWLARMESSHKVRCLWLLCFMYVMQESPEALVRETLRSYCHPDSFLIHRFIRLLRLSSSTFQYFIDQETNSPGLSMLPQGMSSWLMQESFNTICAATNMVVDECANPMSAYPREQKKMIQSVLDLLLHVLAAPQSSVTHLRALGGSLQSLMKFGVDLFIEIAGDSLQHWARVLLTLMNSVSLSVRSIATDFVVSLLGGIFDLHGNIDDVALVFLTLIPEVAAREMALYGVAGLVKSVEDLETSVWPLRRALADVEEANPLDDDRVDPQLSPILSVFCRACQAGIDGVLIELRLLEDKCSIAGFNVPMKSREAYFFDADEESLFEVANFFLPETGPLQRLRWLLSLKALHESKGQWVEAAETLMLCARTISDAIPHLRNAWRPSRFELWRDSRRSIWLTTIGKDLGYPDRGNTEVIDFADSFLEPPGIFFPPGPNKSAGEMLPQPSVSSMCNMLMVVTKEAVTKYLMENGMEEWAYARLESLLKVVMQVVDNHSARSLAQAIGASRRRVLEENAALRKVSASLNGEMTRLTDRIISAGEAVQGNVLSRRPHFVKILLSGEKPKRFKESTTLPTFLEWDKTCVCRVPSTIITKASTNKFRHLQELEEHICLEFISSLRKEIKNLSKTESLVVRTSISGKPCESIKLDETATTFIELSLLRMDPSLEVTTAHWRESKRFYYYRSSLLELQGIPGLETPDQQTLTNLVELAVAQPFPCALSRQRTLLNTVHHAVNNG